MRSCTLRVQANNASNLASGSSCHLMLFTCMLLFVHEPRLLLLMDRLAAEEQPTLTLEMGAMLCASLLSAASNTHWQSNRTPRKVSAAGLPWLECFRAQSCT